MPDVEIPFDGDGGYPVLHCPRCECGYLHLGQTEVFERASRDARDGLYVSVCGTRAEVSTDLHDTPQRQRDGVDITFGCEWCCIQLVLTLTSYHGQTFLSWHDRHGDTACGPDCDRYPALAKEER